MNEWNKLYSEIYGNPTSIMHETKGSNDVKNTIWILNWLICILKNSSNKNDSLFQNRYIL